MFKRNLGGKEVVIPQRNHAHLAGNIAMYWGNNVFEQPRIPLKIVVNGIAFHQNGYDLLDTQNVTEIQKGRLFHVLRKDFYSAWNDNESQLVNMFHQARLTNGLKEKLQSEELSSLEKEFKGQIKKHLQTSKYNMEDFHWANRITHLCDKLSFNFCLGNTTEEAIPLFHKVIDQNTTDTNHCLIDDGTILVDPWPFSTQEVKSSIIAYDVKTYPRILEPQLLQLVIKPRINEF